MLLRKLNPKPKSNAPPKESPPPSQQPEQNPPAAEPSEKDLDEWADEIIKSVPVLW